MCMRTIWASVPDMVFILWNRREGENGKPKLKSRLVEGWWGRITVIGLISTLNWLLHIIKYPPFFEYQKQLKSHVCY